MGLTNLGDNGRNSLLLGLENKMKSYAQYVSLTEATARLSVVLGRPKLSRRTVSQWINRNLLKAKKMHPSQQGRVLVLASSIERLPSKLPRA